jgi:hypothetical protein
MRFSLHMGLQMSQHGSNLTIHGYLMLRLSMHGSVPPFPHVSGWRHAQVQLYLHFATAGQQEMYVFSFVNTFHTEVYK